jgi:hypothetical protein
MDSQNSLSSSEESIAKNVAISVIGIVVFIAVYKYWPGLSDQKSTVVGHVSVPVSTPIPFATPELATQPVVYQDFFIPIARNFMPIAKLQSTSFNPAQAVPKLPAGLKNLSPLSQIIENRGQVVYKDYQDKYIPENTIDADWVTNWRTTTDSTPYFSYITYQFDKPIELSQIRYKADWDSKEAYDNQVMLSFWIYDENIGYWQLLGTQTLTKKTMSLAHILTFTPVTAKQLRVQYDDPDDSWGGWGNIYEVQAIGTDASVITRETVLDPVVQ